MIFATASTCDSFSVSPVLYRPWMLSHLESSKRTKVPLPACMVYLRSESLNQGLDGVTIDLVDSYPRPDSTHISSNECSSRAHEAHPCLAMYQHRRYNRSAATTAISAIFSDFTSFIDQVATLGSAFDVVAAPALAVEVGIGGTYVLVTSLEEDGFVLVSDVLRFVPVPHF